MAIESLDDGGLMITGDSIQAYRLLAIKKVMEVELKTGMKLSRICPFKSARAQFGITARAKQKVYDEFCKMLGL